MALSHQVDEFAIFTAASEAFTQKTKLLDCTKYRTLSGVVDLAKTNNVKVRGYVSCVVGCPYQGEVEPERFRCVNNCWHWGAMKSALVTP